VNGHVAGVVLLDGLKQKRAVAPGFFPLARSVMLVLEDYGQLRPELPGHLGVKPRVRRGLHADAVVPKGHAFGQGVIGYGKMPPRLARSGEVVADCQQRHFEVPAVQVHVNLTTL